MGRVEVLSFRGARQREPGNLETTREIPGLSPQVGNCRPKAHPGVTVHPQIGCAIQRKKTRFALLPGHDGLNNPPSKKAGAAAGFSSRYLTPRN
jgi:hypothetical protein